MKIKIDPLDLMGWAVGLAITAGCVAFAASVVALAVALWRWAL